MAQAPAAPQTVHEEGEPLAVREGITADEYFRMPETVIPHNLIDGVLYMSPSPFWRHQKIVGDLYDAMRHVARELGGSALISPMDCRLPDGSVVQPDVGYIAPESLGIIHDHIVGPPDLVIEVLSRGTRRFDRTKKLAVYARNGVREAWLVDPDSETVIVFTGDGGRWIREQSILFGEPIPSFVLPPATYGLSPTPPAGNVASGQLPAADQDRADPHIS